MRACSKRLSALTLSLAVCGACVSAAPAQEAGEQPAFVVELNRMDMQDKTCRLTFVARNSLGGDIEKAGFEAVLFDAKGLVERMTVFAFGSMPRGKTLVRRFDLANTDCAGISRILVNSVSDCAGDGVAPGACADALVTDNKTDITFGR